MILLYKVLITLLYPFLIIVIYVRKLLKKEDAYRFKEKIFVSNFNTFHKNKSKLVWFHAASIGEFKSIIPILNQLNKDKNNIKFLITTTTLSSGNLARIELQKFDNVTHRYLPLDIPFLIEKFLLSWKPDKIFLVDSEIWPNLIFKAKNKKIPIALINARLTQKSFDRWVMFPHSAKKIFNIFDLCICSNTQTKEFLEKLGAKNIFFKGNIKFISQNENEKNKINDKIILPKRFWFAASTHRDEDIVCLKTHLRLKEKFNDIITIIAPRHIERSREIKSLSSKLNLNAQIVNKDQIISKGKEIIIINYFGALNDFFKYAKSVFIGKSMIKKLEKEGGQNPIEAAKLNCKIYHGPYIYNFKQIYEILEMNSISKKINSYEELSENLIKDLENPSKLNDKTPESLEKLSKKTLDDTMILLNKFLFNDVK